MAPQLTTMPDVLAGNESSPAIYVGSGGPSFTRGDLHRLAIQFAETLRQSGTKPGDTITIADLNTVSAGPGSMWLTTCNTHCTSYKATDRQ